MVLFASLGLTSIIQSKKIPKITLWVLFFDATIIFVETFPFV